MLFGLVSPLDAIAEEYLQSAHMLQHVLIADLGVVLALLAVRGPLSMFFLPRDLLVRDLAGEELLLLLHRVPQGFVAHEHGVQDLARVVVEVVLAEHVQARVLGHHDLARCVDGVECLELPGDLFR